MFGWSPSFQTPHEPRPTLIAFPTEHGKLREGADVAPKWTIGYQQCAYFAKGKNPMKDKIHFGPLSMKTTRDPFPGQPFILVYSETQSNYHNALVPLL